MDKYKKIRVIGRGASGVVHLCGQLPGYEWVILKEIPIEPMTKDERQATLNEIKVLSMLRHPNIIEYYENFIEDKAMMIVMEYAPGGTLSDYLQQRGTQLLDEEEVLSFFCQMLLALDHVHSRRILHRDLKAENILLSKHHDIIKIGDFGISKILSSKTKAYTIVGSPCYISPELCEGKPYNEKSDIWALGCVLYELLTLRKAFEAPNLPALVMKITRGLFTPIESCYSQELHQLLMSMLHLDPSKRPTVAKIMAYPIIIQPLYRFLIDAGRITCSTRLRCLFPHFSKEPKDTLQESSGGSTYFASSGGDINAQCLVYAWEYEISDPIRLTSPALESEIVQVAVGKSQRIAVTKRGRVISWEETRTKVDGNEKTEIRFEPHCIDEGSFTVKQVGCGDGYIACLTDRGILLTYGSGDSGCLGHGNYQDVKRAKIVESLLGVDVVQISCGGSHVLAVTSDGEVFGWGSGSNGQLGFNNRESYNIPQMVPLLEVSVRKTFCGVDCSMLLTSEKKLLCTGNNRFNKLCLDQIKRNDNDGIRIEEVLEWTHLASFPLLEKNIENVAVATSHAVYLTEEGELFVAGCEGRVPVKIDTLPQINIEAIGAGEHFTIAGTKDGFVYTWDESSSSHFQRCVKKVNLPESENGKLKYLACCEKNILLAIQQA